MSGTQKVLVAAKGISSLNNPLSPSAVPEGTMSEAINVVIDRNDVVEPRRGFAQYGSTFGSGTDRTKQLINYKDTVLRHAVNALAYDSNLAGTFTNFTGPAIVETQAGLRIKSVESNGNLYFSTQTGIKKLSARSSADFSSIAIEKAGGVKALDLSALPNYTTTGFLEAYSKVAYRIVWGYKDLNENLILGYPSARKVVYNSTAGSCIVDLTFSVPSEVISTKYFYQVYRTGVFSGSITVEAPDPGDEMYLVFEDNVTSSQIVARSVLVKDITPEDFRKNGTLLYTNPNSGTGIASANEKPPFAKDLCLYKGYTFYANTKTVQRLNLSILSVQAMVSNVSSITIQNSSHTGTYFFQGSTESFAVNFNTFIRANFVNTSPTPAKYFTLTSANDDRTYYVWYYESINDQDPLVPGAVGIKVTIIAGDMTEADFITKTVTVIGNTTTDFNLSVTGNIITATCANNGPVVTVPTKTITGLTVSKDGLGTGEDIANNKIFLPRVPTGTQNGPTTSQQLEQIGTSLVRVISNKDNIVYAYYLSGYSDVPGQVSFEQQDVTGEAFWLTADSNAVGAQFTPTLSTTGTVVISSNEVRPNRIYYSKFQQPEAVPIGDYLDIGPQDREIKRIIALQDSLFVLKEDGIYRLTGESAPFTLSPFDFSAQVLSPDTAVVLNNQIYALSTQGVIVITDGGVSVISRPIENQLLKITRDGFNYKSSSFGISYETDRSYLLWVVTNASDTVATQCFRYNTFTQSWTRWDISKTCGIVNFADNKLYLGAGDTNFIEKERKTLTRNDYADREYVKQILSSGVVGNKISLNSASNTEVGDVILQKQYLTGADFNRVLQKLDIDLQVTQTDYLATLAFSSGGDIQSKVTDLTIKLDADPGVVDSDYYATISGIITSDFSVIQTCFNLIVSKLNSDFGVSFINYPLSIGTQEYEAVILTVDRIANTVSIGLPLEYQLGPVTIYKAINSTIVWNPQFFGDPSVEKQVREGTIMFENSNFSKISIGYATDRAPAFAETLFNGAGNGDFGQFVWGSINFGGAAAPTPLRTYIPMDKQRCRLMNVKLTHKVAFEKFAVFGYSLTFRGYNIRTTR